MKTAIIAGVILLMAFGFAFAQQDPDDPGIQDSIIIGSTYVDSGATIGVVPVYFETDDSVMFYHMAISYASADTNIRAQWPHIYFPPFTEWGRDCDTAYCDEQYIDLCGFSDNPINTYGVRVQVMTLAFNISRNAPRQLVPLDTIWDVRNHGTIFGLIDGITEITPGIQRGFIGYGVTGIDEEDTETPRAFSLRQNYPNPFNPSTEIGFSILQDGPISLVIYDLLGRQVRKLLDEPMKAGSYSVIWDGRNGADIDVPSGVYLYRLTSAAFSDTKRMILLR